MKNYHECYWLLGYETLKIFVIVAITLKHYVLFAKFLKILLENNVASPRTYMN